MRAQNKLNAYHDLLLTPQHALAALHPARLFLRSGEQSLLPYLFLGNLSILAVGMGVRPILPFYVGEFGASATLAGLSVALIYVAITLGSWLTAWSAGKIPPRTLLVAAGALGAPAVIGIGQAAALWQVVLLAGVVWFTGGIGLGLISIFASQQARENERGKWFGWIALTTPAGSILGGLLVSRLVASGGYPVMFLVMGLVYALWPLVGLFKIRNAAAPTAQVKRAAPAGVPAGAQPGRAFRLLLMATLFSALTVSVSSLGLSLSMKAQAFSPAAIADANMLAGLAAIPVTLGLGPLSDRVGRKGFLIAGYLLAAFGGAMLVVATGLWQFQAIATAILISRTAGGALSGALAADVLSKAALERGLPRLQMMNWIAAIAGSAASGFLLDVAGPTTLFLLATLLSLGAVGLAAALPARRETRGAVQPASPLSQVDCL